MYKTLCLSLLLAIVVMSSRSQLVLTSSINPSAGDIQVQVKADTTGITQGNSGANQLWNFLNLVRQDSTNIFWLLPSSTPYANLFPASDMAALDTCYNYFNEQSSFIEIVGYYSHGEAVHYQNPETILTYPFTYNSTMNDNFATGFKINGDSVYETGTETALGDAYGIINLPFGTFINSLRIKHTINIYDTSITYQQAFHTTYTIYEWYVPGKKFSVFKIIYISISVPPYNFSFKNVFYNPASVPIGIRPVSNEVPSKFSLTQNYPNPFNPSSKIKMQIAKLGNVRLTIYDALGREVETIVNEKLSPGTYEVEWDASKYGSGVYFYRLTSADFTETKRMMLIK